MNEVWKTVIYQGEEYPKFEVSNLGRIRNVETGRVLKQWVNKNGYCQINVSLGGRGNTKIFKMHKAVAETFISNPDGKPMVNHIDCDKTNNHVSNLEWATNGENIKHAWDNGLMVSGASKHLRKLSEEQVEYIRNNYIPKDKNFGSRALAKKFGLHHTTILSLLKNETYTNIS